MEGDRAKAEAIARNRYDAWNRRLLETFFSPASSGEEVFLQISPAELDSIGPDLGGDEAFLAAIRSAPIWVHTGTDVFAAAIRLCELRSGSRELSSAYIDPGERSRTYVGLNAPAYLPHLAVLVRSTAACDDQGFYRHLQQALKLPGTWGSQQMATMEKVWQDLERWTTERKGSFGKFTFRILGGYTRIGVPRAQQIMSRRDSEQCARVFAQEGLRPGQNLTESQLREVVLRASDSSFLTAAFRQAIGKSAFAEPINVRMRSLFEDWDGTIPARAAQSTGHASAPEGTTETDELGLVLGLQEENSLPWEVKWRVPPLRDEGRLLLRFGSASWSAQFGGLEGSTSRQESGDPDAARSVLSGLANEDLEFSATVSEEEDGRETPICPIRLPRRQLWVLAFKASGENLQELREDSLPLHGVAYLLAPPGNARLLRDYLEREKLKHTIVDSSGLPIGWVLACLHDCGALTSEQRDMVPDGENERPAPRALRLIGGRSFRRGGVRQYASYDLPTIELDAPQGAKLHCPLLTLSEEPSPRPSGLATDLPLRRFRIIQSDIGAKSYQIIAMFEQELVGSVRLRVAANSGEHVEHGDLFSLDRFGYPQRDGNGLRGCLPSPVGESDASLLGGTPFKIGKGGLGATPIDATEYCAPQLFLDSLARTGSISYGDARDQLVRLLSEKGVATTPVEVLLELRSRGHLEIQTNHKGHLMRVYAVQPALYELPVTSDECRLLGVLGSLRLAQWESLARLDVGGTAFVGHRGDGLLQPWRVAVDDPDLIQIAAQDIGLDLHNRPAEEIAAWAAPLGEVASRIFEDTGESLGSAASSGGAEKFSPGYGYFSSGSAKVDPFPSSQLFRLEDLESTRLRTHAISIAQENGSPRYAFVRDSRWGVWIALRSFADYLSQHCSINDASPWPIPYSETNGMLWFPARISPPVALERALVLCSGDRPELVTTNAESTAHGISLSRQPSGEPIGTVSIVYEKMAKGKWLAYKWVPRKIALLVAEKIGGKLASM
ncbi:MAG: hypothetical protein KDB22_16870 [Planctomycetales bacterium]|nr:hypothetical protein [Planctomycetales bacterium]